MRTRQPATLTRVAFVAALAVLGVLVALTLTRAIVRSGDSASAQVDGTAIPVPREAKRIQEQFLNVVRSVSPAVVQIQTVQGLGSGVVIDGDGDVVTNAHVVTGSRRFLVTLVGGANLTARLLGVDREHDLAVIRVNGSAPRQASFADSSKVRPGDFAIAIGNPLGLRSSVTQGIVSSVDRKVSEGNGVTLSSTIQTSAEINPGNSGGALVDLSGRVIGIPTLAATDPEIGGAAPGIGFAIPSNTVTSVARRLVSSGG